MSRMKSIKPHWGAPVVFCVTVLLPVVGAAQNTGVVTTVRMASEPGHAMVGIECHINGSHRRNVCVIDSGATYTVISDRLVKPDGPTKELDTSNGVVHVHEQELSLTISEGLQLKSRALVESKLPEKIDVLIGQDVLRQFKYVIFDYENRVVEFQK